MAKYLSHVLTIGELTSILVELSYEMKNDDDDDCFLLFASFGMRAEIQYG